jgi:hypothetical protein
MGSNVRTILILTLSLLMSSTMQVNHVRTEGLNNSSPIVLRAQIVNVEIKTSPESNVNVIATVMLDFRNAGSRPLILFLKEGAFPSCVGTVLTRTSGPAVGDNLLLSEYHGLSIDRSPEWKTLRVVLDQRAPPGKITRMIEPGEGWQMQARLYMYPPSKPKFRGDRSAVTWGTLRKTSPLWIRVECETWPLNVERDHRNMRFGRQLQKRWRKSGILQLDPITSEPVVLELKAND